MIVETVSPARRWIGLTSEALGQAHATPQGDRRHRNSAASSDGTNRDHGHRRTRGRGCCQGPPDHKAATLTDAGANSRPRPAAAGLGPGAGRLSPCASQPAARTFTPACCRLPRRRRGGAPDAGHPDRLGRGQRLPSPGPGLARCHLGRDPRRLWRGCCLHRQGHGAGLRRTRRRSHPSCRRRLLGRCLLCALAGAQQRRPVHAILAFSPGFMAPARTEDSPRFFVSHGCGIPSCRSTAPAAGSCRA